MVKNHSINTLKKSFFISSTFSDLKRERELLMYQIESLGHNYFAVESIIPNFPIKDQISQAIKETDYVVLLLGERYGSIDNNGKSFVENEYIESIKSNKNVLTFIKLSSSNKNLNEVHLDTFKEQLLSKHLVYFWQNERELLEKFSIALQSLDKKPSLNNFALYSKNIEVAENPKIISDVRIINNYILDKIKYKPLDIHKLNPREFEILIAELFEKEGYKVHLTKETRDGGKDVMILENNILGNFLIYAECKKYSPNNPVGVNLVRELYGTVTADKATAGIMITSSYFSRDAEEFSQKIKHQMNLIDFNFLNLWINRISIKH